ncbi:MAG: hypothetical protein AB7O59_20695 [Pirellulales bacterium]
MDITTPSTFLMVGGVGGALCYGIACWKKWTPVAVELLFESCVCGALTAAAIHLLVCVVTPENLVHFHDSKGVLWDHSTYDASLADSHIIDLLAGGFSAVFLAAKGLYSACTRSRPKATP